MKSAIAPMPMAIIALVMTKAHRADKNTKRQPMMKIAAWAGRRCSGVGRIVPSKWTLRPLSRSNGVPGLVHLRQRFVRRRHRPTISTSCCSSTCVRGASSRNYAREHPEVVSAVMISASLDWAAMTIAAVLTEEESAPRNGGLVRAHGLVRPRGGGC